MRVVAGRYKGHNLKTLKGEATRPTTMRVKESLFSSLTSMLGSFEGLNVLDAFAGSGALGIEALSRGADHVIFFEKSRQAAQVVSENLKKVKAPQDSYVIELGDALRSAGRFHAMSFDLVFLDPPYAIEPACVLEYVESLASASALNADALICYELAKKNKPACLEQAHRLKWAAVSVKDFGDTSYVLLRKGD